ncbi:nucleoside hydrolase [Nocardia sp. NPDC004568]|uniref:nucleoside hydrolase n=1 Tax=Nocardia sp. NPDC004568 TaxID=3154551 RepID=UPI0033A5F120
MNLTRACERSSGPVTWVGQGPMTNLASVVHAEPGLADRIQVTQQGGWLDRYRDKTRASHNLRLDPVAAGVALRTVVRPRLLLSDFTGVDDITIGRDSFLYGLLTAPGNLEWARWLAVGLARWFDLGKPSRMHDPLALSAALGLPFVEFQDCRVRIEPDARLYRDPEGRILKVATDVAYGSFMAWLVETLAAGLGLYRCSAAPTRHCQWVTAGSGATVESPTMEAAEGQGWKPFSATQRRVLEAMADGEQLQARELYERLRLPRIHSAARTVNWLARHGYIERINNADDEGEAPGVWVLTEKGTAAAANPDDGYQLRYDGLPA